MTSPLRPRHMFSRPPFSHHLPSPHPRTHNYISSSSCFNSSHLSRSSSSAHFLHKIPFPIIPMHLLSVDRQGKTEAKNQEGISVSMKGTRRQKKGGENLPNLNSLVYLYLAPQLGCSFFPQFFFPWTPSILCLAIAYSGHKYLYLFSEYSTSVPTLSISALWYTH